MTQEYKVLVTGPMGAGKTTLIAAVSDTAPVTTEAENLDRAGYDKDTTTVALDYGEVALDGGDRLRLYGTPGQARFDFMWKVLGQGALGAVILIDNSSADPRADLKTLLERFGPLIGESAGVVGVTRMREHPTPSVADFVKVVDACAFSIPVFAVDARKRDDAMLLLDALLHQIEAAALRGERSAAIDGASR